MQPSIRASASADLALGLPAPGRLPATTRARLTALAATPAGRIGLVLLAITIGAALFAPLLATSDPFALSGPSLAPPTMAHPMGTDALGRDLFSGVLYGARTSLLIAATASLLAFGVGLCVGLTAGYAPPAWDGSLMRATEVFQVLPRFLIIIVAVALFGAGVIVLVLTIGLTSWPGLARMIRAEVVSLRQVDFVRAAVATGAPPLRVLRRELLPNVMPLAVTMLGLSFGQVLLLEATLGFLGASDPSSISWGMLAGQAQGYLRVAWWLALFPGLAIAAAVLGINLVVDSWSRPRA